MIITLIVSLLVNVYIVGLNQLYDVEIDKINKPYLPIASGELSKRSGWLLVFFSCVPYLLLVCLSLIGLVC